MEVRGGGLMKFLVAILGLFLASAVSAQTSPRRDVPKYNPAAESVFKGTVDNVIERRCPVSGGVGSHILLRLQDNTTIEVHLATTEFTKMIEMNLRKGDRIEITGFKTEFEGVPTIFARSVAHGIDTFIFRDKDGLPAW
jgi:DNA/RNA endonuclease YhcR with UshA esterase domain